MSFTGKQNSTLIWHYTCGIILFAQTDSGEGGIQAEEVSCRGEVWSSRRGKTEAGAGDRLFTRTLKWGGFDCKTPKLHKTNICLTHM